MHNRKLLTAGMALFLMLMNPAQSMAGRIGDLLYNSCSRSVSLEIARVKLFLDYKKSIDKELEIEKISPKEAMSKYQNFVEYYIDQDFAFLKKLNDTTWKNVDKELKEILNLEHQMKHGAVLKTSAQLLLTIPTDLRIERVFIENCHAIALGNN